MKESDIKRNPHLDFKKVEASRPAWDRDAEGFKYTQVASPSWNFGSGANDLATEDQQRKQHVTIDPFAEGRAPVNNYKLLISAVVPRPIAFVSTVSPDGKTTNLAPFSYFQVINHDPPLFVIGFASSLEGAAAAKHTLHNLAETRECTVNIISEHFAEAANSTSINAPYGASEWAVSGLTPSYDCHTVKPARVKEAVFSIEAKLESLREFESRSKPGTKNATMVIIEGTRFWVREDAINEDRNVIDPSVGVLSLACAMMCLSAHHPTLFHVLSC
jgi:flavin reductase (DIM6/NTAB) family NADH-FMN oxidoreductase RutF